MHISRHKFVLNLATGLLLLGGIGASAQTPPAPTPDSGGFSTRPLVPAAGEVTLLFLELDFGHFGRPTLTNAPHERNF